jgi:hypothetical protein
MLIIDPSSNDNQNLKKRKNTEVINSSSKSVISKKQKFNDIQDNGFGNRLIYSFKYILMFSSLIFFF